MICWVGCIEISVFFFSVALIERREENMKKRKERGKESMEKRHP